MDNLYIDYENGSVLGKKMIDESNSLKDLLINYNDIQDKLKCLINEYTEREYIRPININIKILYKLSDVIEETGNVLVDISAAYKKIDEISNEEV